MERECENLSGGEMQMVAIARALVGAPGLIPAVQWVVIGLLIIGFLWFRPKGVVPEKPGRIPAAATAGVRLAEEAGAH